MTKSDYDHKRIEKKWQDSWTASEIYKATEDSSKEKYYILNEFPYPSGDGLHVGHLKGNIGTDVFSRYKRMRGYSVLHPMGWDAFGLPAENYAIKNKIHPRVAVEKNIANFKAQLSALGLDYSWDREIDTTDPEYYKWTQWIFLQIFKKGLAYESHEPINWCPSCQTGLANEDLEDGKCERCGSVVVKKPIRQWVIAITKYADKLLDDLEGLKWPAHIKEMQRAWIGRSKGLTFTHIVDDLKIKFQTFSAHPEYSEADTYIAIASDHPILADLINGVSNREEIEKKIEEINLQKLKADRSEDYIDGVFTGRYAMDPLGGDKMPIWVTSFALADYGTGIIRCSRYDERDLKFADKFGIKLKPEVEKRDREYFVNLGVAEEKTMYKLRDWVFSRQRYWGEPIPLIHCAGKCGVVPVPEQDLPVKLPDVKHYEPTGTGESPLANIPEWVNVKCPKCGGEGKRETNTMPQWAGSSWYWLRFMDPHNGTEFVRKEKEKYWGPVDLYIGGSEHTTRHLIYARFWHKFLFEEGYVSTSEPFSDRLNLGLILGSDGRKISKRLGNGANPLEVVERFGADTMRVYMMFLGPYADTVAWNDDAIIGPRRFLERVWRLQEKVAKDGAEGESMDISTYASAVTGMLENFKFNTAIPKLMELSSKLAGLASIKRADFEALLLMLAPFAPHIAEELWHNLGNANSIHLASWPSAETRGESEISVQSIPVQIAGKVRAHVYISSDTKEEEVREVVLANAEVQKWLDGKEVSKIVYKKGKIISLVT